MKRDEPVRGAGFWRRLAAHALVDLPLLMLVLTPLLFIVMLRVYGLERMLVPGEVQPPWWWNVILNAVLLAALVALWKMTQATPGKQVFRLKIVDGTTGGKASTGKLLVRSIGYLVASLPIVPVHFDVLGQTETLWLPLCLGFFWILIDRYHRGWHDLLSGTITVSADQADEEDGLDEEMRELRRLTRLEGTKKKTGSGESRQAEMVDPGLN